MLSSKVSGCYWEISTICVIFIIFVFQSHLISIFILKIVSPQIILNSFKYRILLPNLNEFCNHFSNKHTEIFHADISSKEKIFLHYFLLEYRNFVMSYFSILVSRYPNAASLNLDSKSRPFNSTSLFLYITSQRCFTFTL